MGYLVAEQCCKCGVVFGIDSGHQTALRKSKETFYCPNGHGQCYRESDADVLRRERDRLQQQLAMKDDQIASQGRKIIKAEREIKRMKTRAKAGVCPCCNRTFANMAAHMKTQHPDYNVVSLEKHRGA